MLPQNMSAERRKPVGGFQAESVAMFIGGHSRVPHGAKVENQRERRGSRNNDFPFWSRQLKNFDRGSPFGCDLPLPELNEMRMSG